MMTSYLRQKHGDIFGELLVEKALQRVSPGYNFQRRTDTARATNPVPYRPDYFSHKLHIDQNEKLVAYGVTHVAAIDSHSRYVTAATTMPIKNNQVIYTCIYRYVCMQFM